MEILKNDDGFVVVLDLESDAAQREIVKRLLEKEEIKKALLDFNSSFSVKIKKDAGSIELVFQKENLKIAAETFILNDENKERVIDFLRKTGLLKNSALYLYRDIYILEIVLNPESPVTFRLSELAKKVRLSCRHDFLRLFCKRLAL